MTQTLVAMFDTRDDAARARAKLIAAGFGDDAVTLRAATDDTGTQATTGASTTTTATASGSTYGSDASGGIGDWFRSLFGIDDRDEHVQLHAEAARRGATMVGVEARDAAQAERAIEILHDCGAIDLDERSQQWRSEGWQAGAFASGAGAGTMQRDAASGRLDRDATDEPAGARQRVPVVEEELAIGRRVVQRGGVRVFTRIVETPVEERVQLREEHAEVQRRAVDRPATEADLKAMREGTIEVRETVEEPVVAKRARVVEEVEIGKRAADRTETVRDTLRHTEVDVDQIGAGERTERERAMASRGSATGADPLSRDPEERSTGKAKRKS
jgi:uncharacterized protein (TIGR02271 family)